MIFGWGVSYDELITSERVETLESRRQKLTLNFAIKAQNSARFAHWFTRKNYDGLNLRKEKKYEEFNARTERLKNSPLFYMRRALNAN